MVIRKISIGPDFKNSMNYAVGQEISRFGVTISAIVRDGKEFTVWVKNKEGELLAWKTIVDMPVVIESDLSFAE